MVLKFIKEKWKYIFSAVLGTLLVIVGVNFELKRNDVNLSSREKHKANQKLIQNGLKELSQEDKMGLLRGEFITDEKNTKEKMKQVLGDRFREEYIDKSGSKPSVDFWQMSEDGVPLSKLKDMDIGFKNNSLIYYKLSDIKKVYGKDSHLTPAQIVYLIEKVYGAEKKIKGKTVNITDDEYEKLKKQYIKIKKNVVP